MKILKLKIHNFKVFADNTFDFSSFDDVILCGRNGFGKTTVFDALELLFTGKIKRYENYNKDFHDKQFNIHGKQLVHDEEVPDISIEATVQIKDGKELSLRIDGETADMTPPIDFANVFHQSGDYDNRAVKELKSHYTRLNFLSQDESTEFLKRKESDRSRQIAALFRTDQFDEQINKIDVALSGLKDVINSYKVKLEQKQAAIIALSDRVNQIDKIEENNTAFVHLFKEGTVTWDAEKIDAAPNEIDELIKKDGELDQILYFITHRQENKDRHWNGRIDECLMPDTLRNISFLYKYGSKAQIINAYNVYKANYLRQYNQLGTNSLIHGNVSYVESLSDIISKETVDDLEEKRKEAAKILSASSKVALACNRILENRNQLSYDLNDVELTSCPVCGTSFDSKTSLLSHVSQYESVFKEEAEKMGKIPATVLSNFKESFNKDIIEPAIKYFESNHINEDVANRYALAKQAADSEVYKFAVKIADPDLSTKLSLQEIETAIRERLTSSKKTINKGTDIDLIRQCEDRYGQYLLEGISELDVENKRKYLLQYQWKICTARSQEYSKERGKISALYKKGLKYQDDLKRISKEIRKQREEYLNRVVNDIQILFYIYSGRIMQDSYYGRGVFLNYKVSPSGISRILFVSGNSENDVDVLLNMSSGQLISVAIAFLLSLNKLYDRSQFLAIDDPVQTIDDINLWGLIETLRHEFSDKFLLLSTHEDDSAALIRYKLAMVGLNAHTIDMSTVNHDEKEGGKDE